MITTVGSVRRLLREAAGAEALTALKAAAAGGKPYLKGQWREERPPTRGLRTQVWSAEDPTVGRVYLNLASYTEYAIHGRLRDPSGTRYVWIAGLSPFSGQADGFDATQVLVKRVRGEHKEAEGREAVRRRLWRQFGVDPYEYLGKLDAVAQPGGASGPGSRKSAYKVYGRLGGAPAHTRLRGVAYLAPQDTRFRPNDRVVVEPDGEDRLTVRGQGDDPGVQSWERQR